MPKGQKKAPVGFAQYRKREAPTVNALKSPGTFSLDGVEYAEGDYIVQDPDSGSLEGMKAEAFDSMFEIVRKTWSRKAKATNGSEAPAEGATTETEAQASSEAA